MPLSPFLRKPKNRACKVCGLMFRITKRNSKKRTTCSAACAHKAAVDAVPFGVGARQINRYLRRTRDRCFHCGQWFWSTDGAITCSSECAAEFRAWAKQFEPPPPDNHCIDCDAVISLTATRCRPCAGVARAAKQRPLHPQPANTTAEEWRLTHVSDAYAVSTLGRIWSRETGMVAKQYETEKGYKRVQIGGKQYRVSRLVLSAFIRQPADGEHAAHVNGNKQDNRLHNLVWATDVTNRWHNHVSNRVYPDPMQAGNEYTGAELLLVHHLLMDEGLTHAVIAQARMLPVRVVHAVHEGTVWSWSG